MATHLFKVMALTQWALQEEVVQLVQECVYALQDQTLAALFFMTQIFQVPSCLPGILMISKHLRHNRKLEWNGHYKGWSVFNGANSKSPIPLSLEQLETSSNSFSNNFGRWHGNFGRQETMQYITWVLHSLINVLGRSNKRISARHIPFIRACDSVRLVFVVKWKRGPIIKQLKVT